MEDNMKTHEQRADDDGEVGIKHGQLQSRAFLKKGNGNDRIPVFEKTEAEYQYENIGYERRGSDEAFGQGVHKKIEAQELPFFQGGAGGEKSAPYHGIACQLVGPEKGRQAVDISGDDGQHHAAEHDEAQYDAGDVAELFRSSTEKSQIFF